MLVMTRKPGEQIQVGSGITVLQVRGNWARIGIDAPADVPLVRAELSAGQVQPAGGEESVERVPLCGVQDIRPPPEGGCPGRRAAAQPSR